MNVNCNPVIIKKIVKINLPKHHHTSEKKCILYFMYNKYLLCQRCENKSYNCRELKKDPNGDFDFCRKYGITLFERVREKC